MSKIDELVKEIEQLDLDEQKILFDRLAEILDLLGWVNFYDIKIR